MSVISGKFNRRTKMNEHLSEYMNSLPKSRQTLINELRTRFRKMIAEDFVEVVDLESGMIRYELPLKVYPKTYNKKPLMFAGIANRKGYMTTTLTSIYSEPNLKKSFIEKCQSEGFQISPTNSCLKFKKLEDLPLKEIENCLSNISVSNFIKNYESLMKK